MPSLTQPLSLTSEPLLHEEMSSKPLDSMLPPVSTLAHRRRKRDDDEASVGASVAPSSAPSSVFVPDPCPLKAIPGHVLQEEDYTTAVSELIERDFFPDLPTLRIKHEMMLAMENGQDDEARCLQEKLAQMSRPTPLSTVAATPGSTPQILRGDLMPTPMPEEDCEQRIVTAADHDAAFGAVGVSAWERDDDAASTGGLSVDTAHANLTRLKLVDGKRVVTDLTNVRLDSFQRVFTSEDNASFEEILARDKETRRQKQWWLEASEKYHNTHHKAQVRALEKGNLPPGTIMSTAHQARDGVSFVQHSQPQETPEKPKISFKNTRFTSNQQVELECMLSASMVSRKAREEGRKIENAFEQAAKEGKFSLPSLTAPISRAIGGRMEPALPGENPEKRGFSFVKTPPLLPGVKGVSPLMTYGTVASTPKILEDDARGPNFTMADESDRELAAERLQRGATQRQREAKQQAKSDRLRALGIAPGTPGTRTPSSLCLTPQTVGGKVTPLSPIGQLLHRAQKLAQRGGQLRIGSASAGSSSSRPKSQSTTRSQERSAKRARCGDKVL